MPATVRCSFLLGRSFRNKSSKDMPLPHPQSRKDHYREEHKPSCGGIVWKPFKRTINVTEYRNAKDQVNPAKNRTFGGIFHDQICPPVIGVVEGVSVQVTTRSGP
jgi:hypothetical protein